jgi:hypothetical protein
MSDANDRSSVETHVALAAALESEPDYSGELTILGFGNAMSFSITIWIVLAASAVLVAVLFGFS